MGRKKKSRKRGVQEASRIKITPASLLGICIGLLLIGVGLYSALAMAEYGGLYVVVLGVVFVVAVAWGSVRRK